MKNVDLKSKWEYACFTWIVIMLYFPCHDLMNVSVSSLWWLQKEYLVWVVVWDATHALHKYDLGVVLDEGLNVMLWLMNCLCILWMNCPKVKTLNDKFIFVDLKVVHSVVCGMGRHSYIAHGIAQGYSRWRLNVEIMV